MGLSLGEGGGGKGLRGRDGAGADGLGEGGLMEPLQEVPHLRGGGGRADRWIRGCLVPRTSPLRVGRIKHPPEKMVLPGFCAGDGGNREVRIRPKSFFVFRYKWPLKCCQGPETIRRAIVLSKKKLIIRKIF